MNLVVKVMMNLMWNSCDTTLEPESTRKRKKLLNEARSLLKEIKEDGKDRTKTLGKFGSGRKSKKLKGGAAPAKTIPNKPKENRLKKELNNPQGLDFANQQGSLMGQQHEIEMIPPKDLTKVTTRPEKTTSGMKCEVFRTLRMQTNITDVSMQGKKSISFEYEPSYHNPRFYNAKIKFALKLVKKADGAAYEQFQTTGEDGSNVASEYGPIQVPQFFPQYYFEKAPINVEGGTAVEPENQSHLLTKHVTKLKPEEAKFKYSNLGGYHEDYGPIQASQKYQMPIAITRATGVITPTTGVNYKTMTQAQFTQGTGANNQFQYTSKGVPRLAASFNNGAVQHSEVPLRHICRTAKCESIFLAGKKYYITLHKTKEPFLMQSIDPAAADHLMFQLTECEIEVPIVKLLPEKQEQERQKIMSPEGIIYPV